MSSETISVTDAARMMQVSKPFFYRCVRQGRIGGAHDLGGRVIISRPAFLRWLHQEQPAQPTYTVPPGPLLRVV